MTETKPKQAAAAPRLRRRDRGPRRHRVPGPVEARHRRHLSELRQRPRRLEGEGAGDRRQRPDALLHRPPAPAARSGRGLTSPHDAVAQAPAAARARSARCWGFAVGALSRPRPAHQPLGHGAGKRLRSHRAADAGHRRHVARPALHDPFRQAPAGPRREPRVALRRRRAQRDRASPSRRARHPRLRRPRPRRAREGRRRGHPRDDARARRTARWWC